MHVGNEENVQQIMQHQVHMAGSDAILHGKSVHPRAYGTFSRYLGELINPHQLSVPLAYLGCRPLFP